MRYVSLDTAARSCGITGGTVNMDADDLVLLPIIAAGAERAIDSYTGRSFELAGTVTADRYFAATDAARLIVDDIGSTTGLVVHTDLAFDGGYTTAWASTDFSVRPPNAIAKGRPITQLVRNRAGVQYFPVSSDEPLVKVTARFGWPGTAIVDEVQAASLLQINRHWARRNSPLGILQNPEGGSDRILSKLDPDVEVMVHKFKRNWFGVVI